MIYLQLFLTFLEIGAVAFGGGYAMIPLMRDNVLAHGWLSEAEILNMIAVAESTPGPIAVNMATFVGASKGGLLGSAVATIGVVLPAFVIMLVIAALLKNFLEYKGIKAVMRCIRPCAIALILGTSVTLFMSTILGIKGGISGGIHSDLKGLILLALIFAISFAIQKIKGKKPSPILMIGISALLGIVFYGIF
jgi:chromate transporter